ncbi:MAG TPA: LemA family protein [Candidatus Krumholzibacteria bacterium]|nr:LemA family protein [Candidatus Krumholzibacteria bacterium]
MKKGLVALIVVVVVLGGIALRLVSGYNALVTQQTQVRTAWAEVDNLLLRRNDLIPNLVETVKGFAAQEQAVFGAIADARARLAGAGSTQERIAAGQAMDTALSRLLLVVENYPELRSSENFMRLQDELAGTENRLSVGRTRYNEIAGGFNAAIRRFPMTLMAGLFRFQEEPFYPVAAEAKQVPRVDFQSQRPDTTRG